MFLVPTSSTQIALSSLEQLPAPVQMRVYRIVNSRRGMKVETKLVRLTAMLSAESHGLPRDQARLVAAHLLGI